MRHTTWLATVALVLALVGAARAENTLVGNLDATTASRCASTAQMTASSA